MPGPLILEPGKTQVIEKTVSLSDGLVVVGALAVSRSMRLNTRILAHVANSNYYKTIAALSAVQLHDSYGVSSEVEGVLPLPRLFVDV